MAQADHGSTGGDVGLHAMALSGGATFAGFTALVVSLLIAHNDLPPARDAYIALGGVLVAAAGFVGPTARWLRARLRWSPHAVQIETGTLRLRRSAIPMQRVAEVWVEQSMAGRLLDYGTIWLQDVDGGVAHFGPTPAPHRCATTISPRLGRKGAKPRA